MRALLVTDVARYNCTEPLGLMCLSAVLKRAGHEVRIEFDRLETLEQILRDWQPQLVGYTVTTHEHQRLFELNRRLKSVAPFLSVFGGPHPTFFPEMIEEEGVDVICRGEGEGAIADLAAALANGSKGIATIPNLWVKESDGTIHKNDLRPLIEDLDSLPFPDRDGYYRAYNRPAEEGVARYMASRGCPFNCTFCFNKKYFDLYKGKGSRIRARSPGNFVAEIAETRRKYPLQMAVFQDDCFPSDLDWLTAFRDAYRKEVGVPFVCYQRVERVTPDTCRLMKEAGCRVVLLGIETGNEQLRRDMLHRYMTNDEIRQACKWLHEAGLKFQTTNIVGIPNETLENAMETLSLNVELRPQVASAFFFQPFPHTELGDMAASMGMWDGSLSGMGDMLRGADAWQLPNKKELARLRALFSPVVLAPFLKPLVPLLVRLPLDPVYQWMSKLAIGYSFKFRLYPFRMGPWKTLKRFVRFLKGRGPF